MLPFPPPSKEYESLAEETKFEELKGLALDHKLEEAMIWGPTLPVRGRGGDPQSSFYNSSPFHVDHWRALKVNKAHSLLRMSLWGHNGWNAPHWGSQFQPASRASSFWWKQCFVFFLTGAERGDSGYLEIAGVFKSQDINTDIRLLLATCVSHYLCTWVGAHGIIYLTNQCHIFSYSASLISPSRMSLSSFGSWGYGGFQADFVWVLENLPDPL